MGIEHVRSVGNKENSFQLYILSVCYEYVTKCQRIVLSSPVTTTRL